MIPRNEMEVVVLFSQQAQAAGFEIVSVQVAFPDAIIRRGDTEYKVEFEFRSSNFWAHRHNPTGCDLIICWIDDDEYPVLPIIALSNPDWPQTTIAPPPYQERLVGYWRARALGAEAALQEEQARMEMRMETRVAELNEGVKREIIAFVKFLFRSQERAKRRAFQGYEQAVETTELEDLPDWLKELEDSDPLDLRPVEE